MNSSNSNLNLATLFSLYTSGKQNESDAKTLCSWAKESPQNQQILELLDGKSSLGFEMSQMFSYDQERVWKAICQSYRITQRKRKIRMIGGICAATILLSVVIFTLHINNSNNKVMRNDIVSVVTPGGKGAILEMSSGEQVDLTNLSNQSLTEVDHTTIDVSNGQASFKSSDEQIATPVMNTVSAPKGTEYSLKLSDGTSVWLNSESKITFPTRFTGSERQVTISGEVYFEVAHDAKHPFIVSVGDVRMTVLGTSFNVSAYNETNSVTTTLISGSLKVSIDKQAEDNSIVLSPGQQTLYDNSSRQIISRKVPADLYAAWTKGLFVFFDEPVESLCQKLARWYRIDISVDPSELKGVCLSGVIKKEETFNTVAEILAATEEVVFIEKDGKFEVRAVRK